MSANTFGEAFRVTTFGESHGGGIGVVIDGVPPKLPLSLARIQAELDRRRPGQSSLTTQRQEADAAEILSGVSDQGLTLGTPIALVVRNKDTRSSDYEEMKRVFRPSHADFTWQEKFGIRAVAGGGRASARETIGRVAAGAVARVVIEQFAPVEIVAFVRAVHEVETEIDPFGVTREEVEASTVRCPDPDASTRMIQCIERARADGDSVGGLIECVARNVPAGWGDPVFDRLDATLAHAMLSIPASKGIEFGSGFAASALKGSEHNDEFVRREDGSIGTATNNSGGIQGGISNGEAILFRVAFKPTATIAREQQTVDVDGNPVKLAARGRHDPCVLPRAVPVVEAMAAIVLADHALRQRGQCG